MSDVTKPRLSLLAMLEAAHALRLAGALPAPSGIHVDNLVREGGMRPWLRLALGDEAARAMEAAGTGGWHIGAMLGTERLIPRLPIVEFDPAEASAISAVDALCGEANGPRWSLWFSIRNRIPTAEAEDLLPLFAASAWDGDERSLPASDLLEASLDGIAARFGLSPRKEAADLSTWREREVNGVAERSTSREYYRNSPGTVMTPEGMVVRLDDGSEVWLHEGNPLLWIGRWGPELRQRLRLTWRGATSGHGGYLARVQDLAAIELSQQIRADLAQVEEIEAILARRASMRAIDSEGQELLKNQEVDLLTDCLEASKGSRGRVLEIVGDMAIVNFGRAGARRVPCLGHALIVAA